mmetsp:Transcript_22901/g.45642  ORF Transcript_22901/g.45642 Transcript_22901/m.45642 type:complete len:92 (+) Transcript_22901:276-551(+)
MSYATPLSILKRLKEPDGTKELSYVLGRWLAEGLVITPPKASQAFNQGGSFVFDPDGVLTFAHVDGGTADHADLARLVEAAEEAVGEGRRR